MEFKMKDVKVAARGFLERGSETVREAFFGGASASMAAKATVEGALLAAAGLLLGRTPLLFDSFPMGLSLLCASEKSAVWILAGLIVSVFTVSAEDIVFSPAVYIGAYIFAYLLRMAALVLVDRPEGVSVGGLLRHDRKGTLIRIIRYRYTEGLSLKMACASVAALVIGIYTLRAGEYRYYDLFAALFTILAAPMFTFLYSGIFSERRDGDTFSGILYGISVCTLLFSCIYSLRGAQPLGISASALAGFFTVIYMCRRKEKFLFILILSFAAGLAVSPVLAPSFMLAAAALSASGGGISTSNILFGAAMSLLWGGFAGGLSGVTMLLPAFMTAALAESALDAFVSLFGARTAAAAVPIPSYSAGERLERLSETFMALSQKLAELSHVEKRPSSVEVRGLCLDCSQRLCQNCSMRDGCYREESYGVISDRISHIHSLIMQKGRAEISELPEHLRCGCHKTEQLICDVNASYASLLRESVMRDKSELFALDYEAVSRIISDAARSESEDSTRNAALESRLRKFSQRKGLGFERIAVFGDKSPRLMVGRIGRVAQETRTEELRCMLSDACGFPVTLPVFNIRGGDISMTFEAAECFDAEIGTAVMGKDGEECGDSVRSFKCGGKIYALISDGMGSGDAAMLSSAICSEFMQRMLEGGNRKETAVRMLGAVLRSKGDECSATVDLAELDTVSGELSFLKSGAAPSFVRRGEKLFSLSAKTMPLGILSRYDGEITKFTAEDGDVAILLSDGVSGTPEGCPWLMELLGSDGILSGDPPSVAEDIALKARENGSCDDISVAVIKISRRV